MMSPLALIPDFIERNLGWWLFGLSIVIGLAVGWRDVARLSWQRIWAIATICATEARRRRVYWITPLAILGVIVVSQLQHPLDEQDAIRQTVKFCVFATGLIVAVTTIILACTNLPREIDNRVIYSVVTKPTTRLEVVLGKVIGFARVSLMILLIMGVFSYAYLGVRAWNMRRAIDERLEAGLVPPTSLATMTYYRDAGLLNAKEQEEAAAMQIFARLPHETGDRRYFFGGGEGSMNVPFDLTPEILGDGDRQLGEQMLQQMNEAGLLLVARLGYERIGEKPDAPAAAATQPATAPGEVPYYGPFIMPPEQRAAIMAGVRPTTDPVVTIDVMDANMNFIGMAEPLGPVKTMALVNRTGLSQVRAVISPKVTPQMRGRIYVRVTGMSPDVEYYVDLQQTPMPVEVVLPIDEERMAPIPVTRAGRGAADPKAPAPPIFLTRSGTFGEQLRGARERPPIAVYAFRGAQVRPDADGMTSMELRTGIERSGADDEVAQVTATADVPTEVSVAVRNLETGATSEPVIVRPESNRTVFFRIPAGEMAGGNFDVHLRCLTRGDFLGLTNRSLVLITDTQPFAWNLAKSMLILWLMTVLVTAVAIFCSTFLSWPIAVVLTLVILLGHWGVQQLGDATAPGIGAQVVTDLGLRSPAKAEAVRRTVENLSSFLNFISTILPDISRYAAVEHIERGVAIPFRNIRESLAVTLGFSLPLVLLAYVFLKNKEVAP